MINKDVKTAPFIHGDETALNLHTDLLISLLSVIIISTVQNGLRVLSLCLISAFASWFTETIGLLIRKKHANNDLRSIAMGLIIAMICPVTVPLWLPVSASVISVLFVRVVLGENYKTLFITPVIGWIYMLSVAPKAMMVYPVNQSFSTFPVFENISLENYERIGSVAQQIQANGKLTYSFLDILTGNYPGAFGTTCIFIIIAVCIYFIYRKSMAWQVSLSMILTVSLFAIIFNRTEYSVMFSVLYELTATSYIFIAVFVAGDLINAPTVPGARVIYGFLVGTFTMLFRYMGLGEHCVPFALLIVNFFSEPLEVGMLYLQIFFLRKRMIKRNQ